MGRSTDCQRTDSTNIRKTDRYLNMKYLSVLLYPAVNVLAYCWWNKTSISAQIFDKLHFLMHDVEILID